MPVPLQSLQSTPQCTPQSTPQSNSSTLASQSLVKTLTRTASPARAARSTVKLANSTYNWLLAGRRRRRNVRQRLRQMLTLVGFHDGRRHAWVHWSGLAHSHALMRLALRRARSMSQARALSSWSSWLEELGRLRALRQVVGALRQVRTRHALNSWVDDAAQRARTLELARRGVSGLRRREVTRGMRSWLLESVQRAAAMAMVARAVLHMQRHDEWRTWRTWWAARQHAVASASQLRRSLLRLRQWRLGHALNGWAFEGAQRQRQQQLRRRAVASWTRLGARRALTSWCARVDERAHTRRRVESIVVALGPRGRSLRRALASWAEGSSTRRHQSHAAKALLGVLLPPAQRRLLVLNPLSCRRAFNTWRSVAEPRAHARRLLLKGCAAVLALSPRRAFSSWLVLVVRAARNGYLRERARRALRHLIHQRCGRALRTWGARRAQTVSATALLHVALRHWQGAALLACWYAWAHRARALSTLEAVARHFAAEWTFKQAFGALCCWKEAASVRSSVSSKLRRGGAALWMAHVRTAFGRWHAITDGDGDGDDESGGGGIGEAGTGGNAGRGSGGGGGRLTRRRLTCTSWRRAFRTWARASQLRASALYHARQRGAWRAYSTWRGEARRGRGATSAASCVLHRRRRLGMERWRRGTRATAAERTTTASTQASAVAHQERSGLRAGWAQWTDAAQLARVRSSAAHSTGSLAAIRHLLTDAEAAEWPRAWKSYHGWSQEEMTWREAATWLAELRLSIPVFRPSKYAEYRLKGLGSNHDELRVTPDTASSAILAALRVGEVYRQLLDLLEPLLEQRRRHDSPASAASSAAPPSAAPVADAPRTPPRTPPASARGGARAALASPGSPGFRTPPSRSARVALCSPTAAASSPAVDPPTPAFGAPSPAFGTSSPARGVRSADHRSVSQPWQDSAARATAGGASARASLPSRSPGGAEPVLWRHVESIQACAEASPRGPRQPSSAPSSAPPAAGASPSNWPTPPPPLPSAYWHAPDGRIEFRGARWQDDSWQAAVLGFFRSEGVVSMLGASGSRGLSFGEEGGKAVEHLSALSTLRVLFEMAQSRSWARFVISLTRPTPADSIRMAALARRQHGKLRC